MHTTKRKTSTKLNSRRGLRQSPLTFKRMPKTSRFKHRYNQRSLPRETRVKIITEGDVLKAIEFSRSELSDIVHRRLRRTFHENHDAVDVLPASPTVQRENLHVKFFEFELFSSSPTGRHRLFYLGLQFAGTKFWPPWL